MADAVLNITEAATVTRPTPEAIDQLARRYDEAKRVLAAARLDFGDVEKEAIDLVNAHGIVVPRAEKSRRLNGRLAQLTVTKGDTLTINAERVETLREALEANGRSDFFAKLFTLRSKYEVVDGAESALKTEAISKRLSEKVLNLWGRCISVKAKKPSLKVLIADQAKPAKKLRQKGGAQ